VSPNTQIDVSDILLNGTDYLNWQMPTTIPKNVMSGEQNEIDLILACCHAQFDSNSQSRIKPLLQKRLNWEWIFNSVTAHGVLPILYHSLEVADFLNVPENVRKKLQQGFYINYLRNEKLLEYLDSIVELCKSKNIDVLSFKGPLLSKIIYGEIGFRQISDLDFLIKQQDAESVKDLMMARGFSLVCDSTEENYSQKGFSHISFFDPQKTTIRFDFQWHIGRSYSFFRYDMAELWDRLSYTTFNGNSYLALPNEDLLFLLSMHGNSHEWENLKWICDIAALLYKNDNFDWDRIYRRAKEIGIQRVVFISLALTENLFQIKIPDSIRNHMQRDKMTYVLVDSLKSKLFMARKLHFNAKTRALFSTQDHFIYKIRSRERTFDKLRYIYHNYLPKLYPTAKDRALVKLPRFLSALYYLIRPFRLMAVYGPKLVYEFVSDQKRK
jgi:hypothetical protein